MAERRMFAKTIIDSDAFLDMPLSTQALYFHLSMRADDEGFVNKPKRVQKYIGASDDDLKLLIAKRFILTFESGIIVIKHWKIHNYIQKDRFKPTVYVQEKSLLMLSENNAYTECIQDGYKLYPQVRIGKEMISENINNITTHVRVREYLQNALDMLDIQKRVMTQLHGQEAAEEYENVFGIVVELCQDKDFADKLLVSDDSFLHRCAVEFANGTVSDKVGYIKMACERAKRIR